MVDVATATCRLVTILSFLSYAVISVLVRRQRHSLFALFPQVGTMRLVLLRVCLLISLLTDLLVELDEAKIETDRQTVNERERERATK